MINYFSENLTIDQCVNWRKMGSEVPASTYIPTRQQFLLSREIGNARHNNKLVYLITSANGTGKTSGMINIMANVIFPGTNIYTYAKDLETGEELKRGFFGFDLYENGWPEQWHKKFWIVAHKDGLGEIIDTIHEWWPKKEYTYDEFKEGKIHVAKIVTKTGFTIYFKTTDQERRAFESGNVSWIWFDEPPKKWQYDAAIHRTRKGGFITITATPVFESAWFVDSVIEKMEEELRTTGHSDKYHLTVDIFSNSIEDAGEWDLGIFGIQKKGNLERRRIDSIIENCDEDEKPARIYGKFVHLSGLIYKGYEQDVHRKLLPWKQHKSWYMYRMTIDPHDRIPPAISWERLDPSGQSYVFREFPAVSDDMYGNKLFYQIKDAGPYTIRDFVRFIIEIEEDLELPFGRIVRIMDPNMAKHRLSNTGREVWQEYVYWSKLIYREKGYKDGRKFSFVLNADDDLYEGHARVKDLLKPNIYGEPGLIISPNCHNTDLSFRRYKYKEYKGDRNEWDAPSEIVEGKHKHFMDLRRYSAVIPFKYKPLERQFGYDASDYNEGEDVPDWKVEWRRKYRRRVYKPKGVA